MPTDKLIGYDLDGVIRHNNKSIGSGDIPQEWRTREKLLELHESGKLPDKYYITQPYQLQFIDGALETLKLFHDLGIWQCVVTNQEAIGVGVMSEEDWHLVREVMDMKIRETGGNIDLWSWCPHAPGEVCECRKPSPGQFFEMRDKHNVDLSKMMFIGDNPSDMEAAYRAGCGYRIHIVLENADKEFQHSEYANVTVSSLKDATADILKWLYI